MASARKREESLDKADMEERIKANSPVAYDRLRILAQEVDEDLYRLIINSPPLERMKKAFELTKGKVPVAQAKPLSAKLEREAKDILASKPVPAEIKSESVAKVNQNSQNPQDNIQQGAKLIDSNQHIEAGSEERQRTNTTHSSNAPLTEEEENIKNEALGNALIEAVGHNYHNSEELRVASQHRKLQEDLLYFNSYLDRFKTPDEKSTAPKSNFDIKVKRHNLKSNAKRKFAELDLGAESWSDYYINAGIAQVQLTKDEKFIDPPTDFNIETSSWYKIKFDAAKAFKMTHGEKPKIAEPLQALTMLYRIKGKEKAHEILDMEPVERMKTILNIVKGYHYQNTEIYLPSSDLPRNTIREISKAELNDYNNSTNKLSARKGDLKTINPKKDTSDDAQILKFLSEKGIPACQLPAIRDRISRETDILIALGSPMETQTIEDKYINRYRYANSVDGGDNDMGMPAIKDSNGKQIAAKMTIDEYVRKTTQDLYSSSQVVLHEVFHTLTPSSYLTIDREHTHTPGADSQMHSAKIKEMLNTAHALKRFVYDHLDGHIIKNSDDFQDLYMALWNRFNKAEEMVAIRSKLPRDVKIIFIAYDRMRYIDATHNKCRDYFEEKKADIQKHHEELSSYESIHANLDKLLKIYNEKDPKRQQNLSPELRTILNVITSSKAYHFNCREKFEKWLDSNDIFLQANRSEDKDLGERVYLA